MSLNNSSLIFFFFLSSHLSLVFQVSRWLFDTLFFSFFFVIIKQVFFFLCVIFIYNSNAHFNFDLLLSHNFFLLQKKKELFLFSLSLLMAVLCNYKPSLLQRKPYNIIQCSTFSVKCYSICFWLTYYTSFFFNYLYYNILLKITFLLIVDNSVV